MAKQSILYRLSRTVLPEPYKEGRPTFSHPLIHHNTLEPPSTVTLKLVELENSDACYHSECSNKNTPTNTEE